MSHPKLWRLWLKKLFILIRRYGLMAIAIFIIGIVAMFAWYSRDLPNPDKLVDRQVAQSTKIYDREGKTVLYDIHGDQKRTLIKLQDIPDYVKWATVSTEDKTFYEHHGFNLLAMVKGTLIDPLMGRRARGGSTLTQQLVKNAILTNERSISRKIKEFILSYRIESKFTKDEILQMYLNEIPYGSTSYGIASASQTFFGKDVKDITLAEAAVLVGMPQAPSYYSPYGSNVDKLMARQKYILDTLVENKYITKEQAEEAKKQEIKFAEKRESITAPHFVMYVKEQLSERFGDKVVEQGGLKVTTTLDLKKQDIAEKAVVNGVEKKGKQYQFNNAALLSLDTKTGQILAMVGSKDYFDDTIDGKVNVTTRLRQPGSSIKPLVYAAAFNKGYTPDTILFDVNTKFKTDTKDYEPKNYDLNEHGPVTMRKALQGSLNIPAVKTLYLVGMDNVLNYLDMMGYTSFGERSRFGLALVLGGGEVKMIEHAAAYNVFANQGTYHEPAAILKVEDSKGNVLYEYKDKTRKVLDSNIANMITNVISDNDARAYVFGASNYLVLSGRPVAAKTGTTNDYHDAWTMGFSPQIVTGVWVGNNNNNAMKRGADGSVIAAPIWNEYMSKAHEGMVVENFPGYTPVVTDKAVLNGVSAVETTVKVDKFSGKLATDSTPLSAIEERTFKEMHDILYYVNKDNPQGPVPTNPSDDPQFNNWEAGVQDWINRQKNNPDPAIAAEFQFINSQAPTETDNIHRAEDAPTLTVRYPNNNATINSPILTSDISLYAPRGISRVEYYLDNILIERVSNYPYNLNYTISSMFENGYHQLKVTAFDDIDNQSSITVEINLTGERLSTGMQWETPNSGQVVSRNQFPLTTRLRIDDWALVKKVDFYYQTNGAYQLFGSSIAPSGSQVEMALPGMDYSGSVVLRAQVSLKNGQVKNSPEITINIQ